MTWVHFWGSIQVSTQETMFLTGSTFHEHTLPEEQTRGTSALVNWLLSTIILKCTLPAGLLSTHCWDVSARGSPKRPIALVSYTVNIGSPLWKIRVKIIQTYSPKLNAYYFLLCKRWKRHHTCVNSTLLNRWTERHLLCKMLLARQMKLYPAWKMFFRIPQHIVQR